MSDPDVLRIRWHGRGGQGAKTAVMLLARAAIREGRYAQGSPEYGPERMGAPVQGYNRISDRPIRQRGPIEDPDVVVVLDRSLLATPASMYGIQPGGLLLVNADESASSIADRLPQLVEGLRVHAVDATEIARAETGSPIPNTVMLGALVRLTNAVALESVWAEVEARLGGGSPTLLSGNLGALERAHKEVR